MVKSTRLEDRLPAPADPLRPPPSSFHPRPTPFSGTSLVLVLVLALLLVLVLGPQRRRIIN